MPFAKLQAGSLALALTALSSACSHQASNTVVTPLTPEQRAAFDRGVDFVATLEGLEGRWRGDWDRDLQVRVGSSDVIAAVTITTTRTDTDPAQKVTYRLVAHVDRELVGKPTEAELELPSFPEDPGYATVQANITRVADKQFVAYVKRGADGAAWHLSPASPAVVEATLAQISLLKRDGKEHPAETVIVHNN